MELKPSVRWPLKLSWTNPKYDPLVPNVGKDLSPCASHRRGKAPKQSMTDLSRWTQNNKEKGKSKKKTTKRPDIGSLTILMSRTSSKASPSTHILSMQYSALIQIQLSLIFPLWQCSDQFWGFSKLWPSH